MGPLFYEPSTFGEWPVILAALNRAKWLPMEQPEEQASCESRAPGSGKHMKDQLDSRKLGGIWTSLTGTQDRHHVALMVGSTKRKEVRSSNVIMGS